MAFSVPSSDVSSDVIGDASNNEVPVGAGTFWQALSNASNATYSRATLLCTLADGPGASQLICGMQTLTDPAVNTGHILHVTGRWHVIAGDPSNDFASQILLIGGDINAGGVIVFDWQIIPDEISAETGFTTVSRTLTSDEVDAFRAAGGYALSQIAITSQVNTVDDQASFDTSFVQLEVPGGGAWYKNPNTDSYHFGTDPGAPWVPADAPNFRTYGQENPVQGVSTGGTPIIIVGDGIADTATVTVDGVDATSVVVLNQHTITCTTPAFGGSFTGTQAIDIGGGITKSANVASVTITVTNPDGTSASI